MKWHSPKRPELGDERIRTFFAWLPTFIPQSRKNVWLESVTVQERYGFYGLTEPRLGWRIIREVSLDTRHSSPATP